MDRRAHWNAAWTHRQPEVMSWYQAEPEPSLALIKSVTSPGDAILDVGGGASGLAAALLALGYFDVSVLDVSGAALRELEARLGADAARVRTLEADLLEHEFAPASIQLWHDRAVFHFLTRPSDRARYRTQLERAVSKNGYVIIGTFATDGPRECSGLPVERYDDAGLSAQLGANWQALRTVRHEHHTPSGAVQPFTFVVARHLT